MAAIVRVQGANGISTRP